ncbi:DUF4270 family protein [Polluticaenibacter yanchengensis]|uniref:DUF4270 family protein n=1 Tax=Polluticaenibacter yanchengensis TaxID=3014562 RepID=A0ABT4UKP4_9BACT|nr:DUF4270 family protein [Chitinophagaceae bacterium LY-5]
MIKKSWSGPVLSAFLVVLLFACAKIDTTTIGTDLIPEVDNVHTFDTVLTVSASNYIVKDSTRLEYRDAHVVGGIDNDPQFGTTKSSMFFEVKPSSFPATLVSDSAKGTNAGLDSAVLILNFLGYHGDSAQPVNFKLYETSTNILRDSAVRPSYDIYGKAGDGGQLAASSRLLGQKTMAANRFRDTVYIKRGTKDSVYSTAVNQLRIPLTPEIANYFFKQDTVMYKNDSAFREHFKGFALVPEGPTNTIFYFNAYDAKIEFFYRQRAGGDKVDTTSASMFTFNYSNCGHAIAFNRNYSAASMNNFMAQTPGDETPEVYIQTTPGTAAAITLHGLSDFAKQNRIIHRADLQATELAPASPSYIMPPVALYLDILQDKSKNIYKGIPYDLSPFEKYYCYPSSINFGYYGAFPTKFKSTSTGDSLHIYKFNITRYVQSVVTRGEDQYEFRLSSPFYFFYENCANTTTAYPTQVFMYQYNNSTLNPIGRGRVRLAGGNHPNQELKMKVRIVYSKL